ncbi:MAG: hypothetical protein GYB68_12835 [Chloroflexi bacterium]|nr:hypothetical protein [Chloroflexota bacterium]
MDSINPVDVYWASEDQTVLAIDAQSDFTYQQFVDGMRRAYDMIDASDQPIDVIMDVSAAGPQAMKYKSSISQKAREFTSFKHERLRLIVLVYPNIVVYTIAGILAMLFTPVHFVGSTQIDDAIRIIQKRRASARDQASAAD